MVAMKHVSRAAVDRARRDWDKYIKLLAEGRPPFVVSTDIDPAAAIAAGKSPQSFIPKSLEEKLHDHSKK